MAKHYEFYDEAWRNRIFECPECGWSGTHEEMSGPNMYEDLCDYQCNNCEKMLLIISWPFPWQVREAAANGNEEAIRELSIRSGEGEAFEEFKREWEKSNQELRDSFSERRVNSDGSVVYFNPPPDNKDRPITD